MATPAAPKPKGILKKPSASAQAREVAVQHALIIRDRRELEDRISDTIVELGAALPRSRGPPWTAARPAPSDAAAFKAGVRVFQPSDYEDLIAERNANGLCGYALCPRPRARVAQAGAFKLVNYGRRDFSIVPKAEVERWCGQACARRAMYVKVQLNETAAWERVGIEGIEIDLYEEPRKPGEDDPAVRLAKDMEGLKVEAEMKAVHNAQELALERGETGDQKEKRPVHVNVHEHEVKTKAEGPSLDENKDGHLVTEGYKVKYEA